MAANKKMEIGIINITMHPHSPESYVQLFKRAAHLKVKASLGHKQGARITHPREELFGDVVKRRIVNGDIYKFTEVDTNAPWFNSETDTTAEQSDLGDLGFLKTLKPNSSRHSFIFYPEKHILFYEVWHDGKSLTPNVAEDLVRKIFNDPKLLEEFGEVSVTHLPETDGLQSALSLPTINTIKFNFTRPNEDDLESEERAFMEAMYALNVREIREELIAVKGESITVTDAAKTKAYIAAQNGSVEVKGRDETSSAVSYSTKEHPRVESIKYNPRDYDMNTYSAFSSFVDRIVRSFFN